MIGFDNLIGTRETSIPLILFIGQFWGIFFLLSLITSPIFVNDWFGEATHFLCLEATPNLCYKHFSTEKSFYDWFYPANIRMLRTKNPIEGSICSILTCVFFLRRFHTILSHKMAGQKSRWILSEHLHELFSWSICSTRKNKYATAGWLHPKRMKKKQNRFFLCLLFVRFICPSIPRWINRSVTIRCYNAMERIRKEIKIQNETY